MIDQSDQFASVPVPTEARGGWFKVATVSFAIAFSLPSFLLGLEFSKGLAPDALVYAFITGFLIVSVIGALLGAIGATVHLSSYMLVKIVFGRLGASIANVAFTLSLLGWFGVNIDLFSDTVVRLIEMTYQTSPPTWVVDIIGGSLMTATSVLGFQTIHRLSLLLVPILMVVTCWMAWRVALLMQGADFLPVTDPASMLTFGEAVSSVVGGLILAAITLPDLTRFINHWTGAVKTSFVSYLLLTVFVTVVAGFSGYATGMNNFLLVMLSLGLGGAAFLVIIGGSWVMNTFNLYSCSLGFAATFPRFYGTPSIIIFGILGIGAATLNILDNFIGFLSFLSAIFVPVGGVIMVDFFFSKKTIYRQFDENRLTEISVPALLSWAIGFVTSFATTSGWISMSSIPALDAFFSAALTYWCLIQFRLPGPQFSSKS